jgi:hypothetical protein
MDSWLDASAAPRNNGAAGGHTVGGDVQLNNNVSGSATPSQVVDNTIMNNSPAPSNEGMLNTVLGNPGRSGEGQCLNF